jgi:hypothetical protein
MKLYLNGRDGILNILCHSFGVPFIQVESAFTQNAV